jgi:hypothetical protein
MERQPNLTNKRHRKAFRNEDRSYAQIEPSEPNVGRGYDSDQFFSRRETDPRDMPQHPAKAPKDADRSQAW